MLNVRATMLEGWLADIARREQFVYHRGELARDRALDPGLSALADTMLGHAAGRWDVVSRCGHIRGELIGTGKVELVTRRERGETIYVAKKI
jgi:hypothetical protein